MNLTYVRVGVRALDIELTNITSQQYAALETALALKPQSVTIRGADGNAESLTMYNSDITETRTFEDSSGTRYYNVSFTLTEI